MSTPKNVSALARLAEITTTPHPSVPPPTSASEGIVRYTAEIPKGLHRSLKVFVMDNDMCTYAVTKALFMLLADDDVRRKVTEVIARE